MKEADRNSGVRFCRGLEEKVGGGVLIDLLPLLAPWPPLLLLILSDNAKSG